LSLALFTLVLQMIVLLGMSDPSVMSGAFTPETNPSIYLDSLILGDFHPHLTESGISQGIVPTCGAIASTVIGALAGIYLRKIDEAFLRTKVLLGVGILMCILGMLLGNFIPIIKLIWTPTYVLFMGGLSLQVLGALYWVGRRWPRSRLSFLLEVAGTNALFFYVFAQSVQRILVYAKIHDGDEVIRLRFFVYENWFASWLPGKPGALLYTICFLLLTYTVVYWLYRRRIFVKL
jgi:predicted acyltransferase